MNVTGKPTPRAGWRRSSRTAAPVSPAGGYVVGQSASPRLKLMFRVSLFAALMVGLGVILYLILKPAAPHLPLVTAAVTNYHAPRDHSLPPPPNPFAEEDLERFERLFGEGADRVTRNVRFYDRAAQRGGALTMGESQFMRVLLSPLGSKDFRPGGPKKNVVAFFISAPGQVDQLGRPCLLLADSRPENEKTWLPVEDLLKGIRDTFKDQGHLPDRTRVVVFLDAARWPGQWTWGDLHNTFANRCQVLIPQINDADTAVILSAASGQRSWFDLRSGGSLFGIALAEALGGHADGAGTGGRRNGAITLGELVAYLQGRVAAAADSVWNAEQMPILLTSADGVPDWTVMSSPSGGLPASDDATDPQSQNAALAALEKRWQQVHELWEGYAQLYRQGVAPPESYDPVILAALEHRLQRLDQLAISGKGYQAEFDQLLDGLDGCKALLRSLQREPLRINQAPPELALLERFGASQEMAPGEQEAIQLEWKKWQEKADPAEWKRKLDEATAVRLLWGEDGWLQQKEFSATALTTAEQFLKQAQALPDGPSQLLESHLIRMFAQPDLQHLAGRPVTAIRQALNASRSAMLPNDLRAAYWLAEEIDEVEQERRLACDWVMADGRDAEAVGRLRQLAEDGGPLDELTQEGQRLSHAYGVYDRALHRLPRLAETLLADPAAFEPTSKSVAGQLLEATQAVRNLGAQLRVPLGVTTDKQKSDAVIAAKTLEDMLNAIEERLRIRVSSVVEGEANDQHRLRQALTLLTGAGVTDAQARRQLRQVMVDEGSPTMGPPAVGEVAVTMDPAASDTARAQSLLPGGQHFMTRWLEVTQAPSTAAAGSDNDLRGSADYATVLKALEDQGSAIRLAIDAYLKQDLGTARSDVRSRLQSGGTAVEARQPLEELDRVVRSQTLLITSDQAKLSPAPGMLYALDHQLFLTLLGRRILDDFWCEAKRGEAPFFPSAAGRAMNMLTTGWSDLPPLIRGSNVEDLRQQRQLVAESGQTLQPIGESIMYRGVAIPATAIQLRAPAYLPEAGVVAVTADSDQVVKTVTLGAAGAAAQPDLLETAITVPADLAETVRSIEVRSFFRGLRRSGQLMLNRRQGARLATFQLPHYGPPRVLVSGEAADPVPIVLVLDCSFSMVADDIKMPDGTEQRRMVVAREALRELLERMKTMGQFRVGLILYGHRYGWKPDRVFKVGSNPDTYRAYVRETGGHRDITRNDVEGNPVHDVEVISPLVRNVLDDNQLARLQGKLDEVQPWGTTPLYQAIDEAFGLFEAAQPRPVSGQVIVVTDGGEDTAPFYVSRKTEAKQAIDKWKRRGVNLTVLLIKGTNDAASIRRDLGTEVISVEDKRDLHAKLDELVPRTRFQIERSHDAKTVGEAELGEVVTLEPWPPAGVTVLDGRPVIPGERYQVRLNPGGTPVATEVVLQGGEYLELALRGRRSLEHVGYNAEQRLLQRVPMDGPGSSSISVMVLNPEPPVRQVLEIPIVVQNAEAGKFSPRPAAFWADVVAVGSSGDERDLQYCVTDMEFVAGRPVPVIRCRLWDWPAWATSATLRMWVAMNPLSSRPLPLTTLDQPVQVPGIDGVQFTVSNQQPEEGGYQLNIREQHPANPAGRGVFRLKIDLHPLPDEASHYYYPDSGEVEHVFRYRRTVTGVTAQVTEHAAFVADAASNERTVRVMIPKR